MDSKGRIPVSIERLVVWSYRDCLVHRVDEGTVGLAALEAAQDGILQYKVSGDGVAQCIQRAQLGVKVDGGGLVPLRDAPADAMTLHRYVLTLEPKVRRIVIVNGCLGCWPDWMQRARADGLRVIPRTIDGEIDVWTTSGPSATARKYCPVEIVDDSEAVRAARERYAQWWYALFGAKSLFQSKPDLLARHRVVTQEAPQRPWERVGGARPDAVGFGGNPRLEGRRAGATGIAA